MKFKQYINEKVVVPPMAEINKFTKEIYNYIKTRDNIKNNYDLYDILDDMNRIGERYKISFLYSRGDSQVEGYFAIEGGEYFDSSDHIMVIIYQDDFEKTLTNDNLLGKFILGLKNVLSHEMVHKGQVNKYNPKYKDDIKKQAKELQNLVKKHMDNEMLAYFNRKEEIMAWAISMYNELKNEGHSKEQILSMLKNTESNIEKLMKDSYAFEAMYRILKEYNPKLWKRFLKQVVGYIEADE